MPMIFATRPGAVVKLLDPVLQCTTRFLTLNPDIAYESENSIVTRITVGLQANMQFLHTLGSLIYVYAFGDRVGSVTLSGLSFACPCPGGGPELGAERMLLWYKKNRASKRADPVQITLGQTVLEGFVTGFTEDVVEPSTNLVQWGVQVVTLPGDD